jgi:hypothetical protein
MTIHAIGAMNLTSLEKLKWSIPWLMRYPGWRMCELLRRLTSAGRPRHVILMMANHFEPSWNESRTSLDWATQLSRVESWNEEARLTGLLIRDCDGTPFRHTYFFPAEQYHPSLLESLAELQAEGLGEIEIHLHHGMDKPDTPSNLRRSLEEFRDILAEEHHCLSRINGAGSPMYAFVHGNFALANSIGGVHCGVDSEMRILAETGCYADFTLPGAPAKPQAPRINAIYQSGRPLHERSPHRSGPNLRVNRIPKLPILFTGPLVFDWRRRQRGLPLPGIDNGDITSNYRASLDRFNSWQRANIVIRGRPEWIFVKLFCHGFLPGDQKSTIGEPMRRFLGELLEWADRNGGLKIHFATAREAFNIAMAAIAGHAGDPNLYRDYTLSQIMRTQTRIGVPSAPAVKWGQEQSANRISEEGVRCKR